MTTQPKLLAEEQIDKKNAKYLKKSVNIWEFKFVIFAVYLISGVNIMPEQYQKDKYKKPKYILII